MELDQESVKRCSDYKDLLQRLITVFNKLNQSDMGRMIPFL